VKVMPFNIRAHIIRNGDTTIFTADMVNSLHIGGVSIAIAIPDNEVLLWQPISELKTATKEMFSSERSTGHCALLINRPFDNSLRSSNLRIIHFAEINRISFQAREG
jgi:hypothetical protein